MKSFPGMVLGLAMAMLAHNHLSGQEKLIGYPDQWKFDIPTRTIILTSDQQLMDLQGSYPGRYFSRFTSKEADG